MPQPLTDYFAREAGEYLQQLETLLAAPGAPDGERLLRLARGVRGSAQVADAGPIVQVGERLEQAARELRDGSLVWNAPVRDRVLKTVSDLQVLVHASRSPGPAEEARAREALARWTPADAAAEAPRENADAQLFAFVRRELDAVVAEMAAAEAELVRDPTLREPLRRILRRMRAVRGLAGLEWLSPVTEVLEGVEETIQDAVATAEPIGERQVEVLAAARELLAVAAPALEAPSPTRLPEAALARFRDAIGEGGERGAEEVVPVSTLFYDDAGPHLLQVAAPPEEVVPVESLLLRGEAALAAALALRPAVEAHARENPLLQHTLEELWELLRLAGEPRRA